MDPQPQPPRPSRTLAATLTPSRPRAQGLGARERILRALQRKPPSQWPPRGRGPRFGLRRCWSPRGRCPRRLSEPEASPASLREEEAEEERAGTGEGGGAGEESGGEPWCRQRGLEERLDVETRAELVLEGNRAAEVHAAPIKTRDRMLEKVACYASQADAEQRPTSPSPITNRDRVPIVAGVLDPVRSSVVCSGPSQILEYAEWFISNGARHGLPVVKVKNKFSGDSSEYDGYRDLMLSVKYTGERGLSIIGEIQLHDQRMFELKLKMHKLYKVKRAVAAKNI